MTKMKYFTEEHEWIQIDGNEAIMGITEHAANELGDITYVELPEEGNELIVGDQLGVVESVKAASDIYSPLGGTVVAVNEALEDNPELINESAEAKGWICKLTDFDESELNDLMKSSGYEKYLKSL
ncbi:MAG: glycine cleavage system protein GcvH [Victivallaceae bacterium]|nr:glycine cleavage system protein GcvH [Victivallaceae bacterium]